MVLSPIRLPLSKREFLLGTSALVAWTMVPARGQTPQPISMVAPAAPIIALDPASDYGMSNSDNISNDPSPSLLITLDSSVSEGSIVEIFDNGELYAIHKLTAEEIGNGIVVETGKSRAQGVHNIEATLTTNGGKSSRSNAIPYIFDTSISKSSLTGKSLIGEAVSTVTATFGATRPSAGDVLELWIGGAVTRKKVLGRRS